jgi:beta-xylosidase
MKQLEFILPAAIEINGVFLTDHNRSQLSIGNNRLVNDIRTQFGDLRRYYRADKKTFSVSWNMLPQDAEYTVDRHLGAEDMIKLFESLTGVVDLKIYYDFGEEEEYKAVITDYSSELLKRWLPYRFYDVSLEIEEV